MATLYPEENSPDFFSTQKWKVFQAIFNHAWRVRGGYAFGREVHLFYGDFIADFCFYDRNRKLVEIEYKNTWGDFMSDFKKGYWEKVRRNCQDDVGRYEEIMKHDLINSGKGPHKFAFATDCEKLADRMGEYLEKNFPKYGLLLVGEYGCDIRRNFRDVAKMDWKDEIYGASRGNFGKELPHASMNILKWIINNR